MYIEPNSTIRLIHNAPLDPKYQDTLYFDNAQSQADYFLSLPGQTYQPVTYSRLQKGFTRVEAAIRDVYDVNYMMFRNTDFEGRWFYAFVTSVEYVSDTVCQINFQLDVIQSWFIPSGYLKESFVAREMPIRDNVGDNIEPEPFSLEDFVLNEYKQLDNIGSDLYIVISITDVTQADVVEGNLHDGIYSGSTLYAYKTSEIDKVNALITNYVKAGRPDAITGMWMVPSYCITETDENGVIKATDKAPQTFFSYALGSDPTVDGYKPRNNKLFTYPYTFMHVDDACGGNLTLKFERGINEEIHFQLTGSVEGRNVTLTPCDYAGSLNSGPVGDTNHAPNQMLSLAHADYPLCSWSYDAYQAYLYGSSGINDAITMGKNVLISTAKGNVFGAISGVVTWMQQQITTGMQADISGGTFSTGAAKTTVNQYHFYGGRMTVTAEKARIIDDFFTMFGYATNRVKIPNINSRPHWNYVQTSGCKIDGRIPADYQKEIETIFDNGITFWKNGSEVRNYDLDNSPEV